PCAWLNAALHFTYWRRSAPDVPAVPSTASWELPVRPQGAAVHLQHGGYTSMREIPLSQNQVALVDDVDYPLVSEFRWCYRPERDGRQGYAVRHRKVDGKDRLCYLHREILPAPEGFETIFLNHDTLDCRRENLRVVSKQEARQHHSRARSNSKSGIK